MPIPSYHRSPGPLLSNEPCSSSHFTKNKLSRDPCLGSLAKQSSKELLATGLSAGSLDCCQGKGSQQRLFSFRGDGCWMQSGSKLILPTYSFGSGSRYFTSESQSPQPGSCNGNSIHTGGGGEAAMTQVARWVVCGRCLAHAKNLVSTVGADRDSYGKDRGRAGNSRPPAAESHTEPQSSRVIMPASSLELAG